MFTIPVAMRKFQPLLPFFLLVFTISLRAQSGGWNAITSNDFVGARQQLEAELRQNPQDEQTLAGLLFLAETVQDHDNYERYANRLMTKSWAPHYVWLFGHMYTGDYETALKQTLPESLRLPFMAQKADTLFQYRKFAESKELNQRLVPDWRWSITGPFTNVSGSGFVEKTAIETRPFALTDQFINEQGTEFSWLKVENRRPGSQIKFYYLPDSDGLGTYYANTFITVPTARKAELRITRNEPIKIWIDDQLLLERPRRAASGLWDEEVVSLDLTAGTHRILVKIAEFPEEEGDSRVQLDFNDRYNEGSRDDEEDYGNQIADRLDGTGFVLRLTDPGTGQLFADVVSSFEASYTPAASPWKADFREREYLAFFRRQAEAAPESLWKQYLLAKAFVKSEAMEEGEEYFSRYYDQHPESDAARFLLAKFYDANDKSERAEALLSAMDTVNAPTFAEHYIRLLKINQEQEETEYLAALEHILSFSPTNRAILFRYLNFLKEKGRNDQVKTYVRTFLDKHNTPEWKDSLAEYLEDDSYKPESYKPKTDKELEKEYQKAQKRLKKTFTLRDQYLLISYAKRKEKTADVLRYYDEAIAIMPWRTALAYQKAVFLFEKERTEEALASLQEQLIQEPYDASICETIGDIYIEKKNDAEALRWYRRAEKLGGSGYDLEGKIEKLDNTKQFTGYFNSINLAEVAKDRSWETRYPDEEAVIALYAQQVTYRPETKQLEAVRKAVIHIRNDAGAKRWTEADLRLIGTVTSVKVLKKDGSVNSPDLGWGVAVFKNLQPGDIILVEGTGKHDMPDEIPGEFLDFNILSWPSPVAKATLDLLIPEDLELYTACNRLDCNYTSRDTGALKLLQWTWNDIAKLEDEEATPDNIDAAAWMMLGSVSDWSRVVQWYERKTYQRTEPNYEVLAQGRALIQPGMSEAQIVETLHTFITRDINYSYVPFLNTNYVPKKPGATLSAKVGDCKDVATLMITLLRENGIPAWYTLVSTHTFSSREPRPTLYVFNHAIVAYQTKDGQLHFADLTTDYFPTGILPGSDADAWALVIREGETQLRRLPNHALDPAVTRVELSATARLDADGNLTLDARSRRHGTAAGNWREEYLRATNEDRKKSLSEYFGGGVLSHLDIENFEFDNLDSLNAPLDMRFRLTAYNQLDKVSNLWIMPLPLPLSTPTQKSMFAAKRYNDLDADVLFELSPVRETVDFVLPAGWQLAEMPKDKQFSSPFGDYSLRFEKIPGGLRIHREVTFKQRFINHADFLAFKQFYLQMLDSDGALLALRQ
ncbi:MAG: hypothetical protein JNL02_02050 [Saprospiraceae bacterium]|nr:hypothetical protein [Saprospiraceae bacterium]